MAEENEEIAALKMRIQELELIISGQSPADAHLEAKNVLFNLITNGCSEMFCIVDILGNTDPRESVPRKYSAM